MLAALTVMSLMWWGHWVLGRDVRSRRMKTPVAEPSRHIECGATVAGLRSDPDQGRAGGGAWTALDEHQLTRLLAESAPTAAGVPKPTDDAISEVDHEDLP